MTMTENPEVSAAAPAEADAKAKKGKKGKKEKGGRSNVVPAVILAVGIAAGGYFMGGSDSGAATVDTTVAPEVVEGPLLGVEPMTVNLANGRYLRMAASFQMSDAYEDAVEGEDGGEEFAHHDASRVQDLLISSLGGRDAAGLSTAEGRHEVKEALEAELNEVFDGSVMEIYFTEFVIQ
ncbi:flagellar basal body-associated FliL family protein [Actinomarinicola tropica]|uniref:Flagellar protein FliL n=1 Tax=Actinomarinicola tropica TaxID=2789776 RepID=A0A5Q2RIE3_9ACTN|nr:flagellar basal body-associated FliL family protein [Actinomarinicola tropica]QGG94652.1 hypothetical protein GH723_05755 [Actinomarinicola tropica]